MEEVDIYHASSEEMSNFLELFGKLISEGYHKKGAVIIRTPKEWNGKCKLFAAQKASNMWLEVRKEKLEMIEEGCFQRKYENVLRILKKVKFKNFQEEADSNTPVFESDEARDRSFWEKDCMEVKSYAYNQDGTLFHKDLHESNLNNLNTPLMMQSYAYGKLNKNGKVRKANFPGITTSMLYFGCYGSSFPWHTEDCDLPSVNFLHQGSPKIWYTIPASESKSFENFAKKKFPQFFKCCPVFMRHKSTHIDPKLVIQNGIKCYKVKQEELDMVITFPYCYHTGYNTGFNIAEAVNFAHPMWVDYGVKSKKCQCSHLYNTLIDVELFSRVYHDEKYKNPNKFSIDYSKNYSNEKIEDWKEKVSKFLKKVENDEFGKFSNLRSYLDAYPTESFKSFNYWQNWSAKKNQVTEKSAND